MSAFELTDAGLRFLKDRNLVASSVQIGRDQACWRRRVAELAADEKLNMSEFLQANQQGDPDMATATPDKMFSSAHQVNVKAPSRRYDDTRFRAKNKRGEEVLNPLTGHYAELPSKREHALMGATFRHLAIRGGVVNSSLTEHERELVAEAAHESDWVGEVDGQAMRLPGGASVKSLLDDATSGGLEIVPTWFDDAIVSFPLLYGELFPRVDVVEVPRGRRVEGASVSAPTVSWGQGDAVTTSLFGTASMVAELNTTIFGCAVALEVGRDFLADSPLGVGQLLTSLIGERLAEELDDVIANGNGTDRPQGLFTASGVGTVSTDNSTTGPPTLSDYIALMFGISKQYRAPAYQCCFVSNDVTYRRSRAIKIDAAAVSSDQRPVMAPLTEVSAYQTLGWPHLIQNDIPNGRCAFVALKRFRLYRRQGLSIQFETGGSTLARSNLALVLARGRFGGRLMDANSLAKWTDGQS